MHLRDYLLVFSVRLLAIVKKRRIAILIVLPCKQLEDRRLPSEVMLGAAVVVLEVAVEVPVEVRGSP
jgi:hypothetical protein